MKPGISTVANIELFQQAVKACDEAHHWLQAGIYNGSMTAQEMEQVNRFLSIASSAVQALCNYLHGEEPKPMGP